MALVDDQGRVFGRFNLVDLALMVLLIGLIPIGFGAYFLFRVPAPRLTGIEPVTQQLDREMRITIKGEHFRPYMRVSLGAHQTRGFLFKDPTTAEVVFGDVPPGRYDVVLYDFAQERSRLPQALTITYPALPVTALHAAGFLTGVTSRELAQLKPGFSFQGLADILVVGEPGPDLARAAAGDRLVDIPVQETFKVPLLLRVPCTMQTSTAGTAGCRAASTNGPGVYLGPEIGPGVYLMLPIFEVKLGFLVTQVQPPIAPVPIEITVRVAPSEDAGELAAVGDKDIGANENPLAAGASVGVALHRDRQMTFHVPAFPSVRGWEYAGQTLRVGGPFTFVSSRYQLIGTIMRVPALPPGTVK